MWLPQRQRADKWIFHILNVEYSSCSLKKNTGEKQISKIGLSIKLQIETVVSPASTTQISPITTG